MCAEICQISTNRVQFHGHLRKTRRAKVEANTYSSCGWLQRVKISYLTAAENNIRVSASRTRWYTPIPLPYIHPLVNHVMIVELEPLNVVDNFRGFLVCAYSKTTHVQTHAVEFLQPTTTANWKTTTCYSANVSQFVYDSSLHRNLEPTLYPTGLCY